MTFLASRRWRIFLIAWLLYTAHFATNVVREHYPAFSVAERGTLRLDEYEGFHPDIFVHTDGHAYICNNVAVSVLAALPLFVFDPLLDALEARRKAQLTDAVAPPDATYRTHHRNRRKFLKLVREKGLDLRFGGATVVTSAFFMAPCSALLLVLMYEVLRRRKLERGQATLLTFLFGFGTPIFFRTAHLNHNMFVMYAMFLAFVLLWLRPDNEAPIGRARQVGAGLLAGFCLAADYVGAIVILLLYGYLLSLRLRSVSRWRSWWRTFCETLPFVVGTIPPVLFLLYSQWAMFGNPFLPPQYWMPVVNYTDEGWRGFAWPAPDLFLKNLFDPSYGMYTYGPLLIIGLWPVWRYAQEKLILPRRERYFVIACWLAFLLFCSANQYARMQFNTGFRYLVPLVPLIFLALSDHLVRLPRPWVAAITFVAVLHTWVLSMMREPVPLSWRLFLSDGPTLPWLSVLRKTSPADAPFITHPLLPLLILGLILAASLALWHYGARLETRRAAA